MSDILDLKIAPASTSPQNSEKSRSEPSSPSQAVSASGDGSGQDGMKMALSPHCQVAERIPTGVRRRGSMLSMRPVDKGLPVC